MAISAPRCWFSSVFSSYRYPTPFPCQPPILRRSISTVTPTAINHRSHCMVAPNAINYRKISPIPPNKINKQKSAGGLREEKSYAFRDRKCWKRDLRVSQSTAFRSFSTQSQEDDEEMESGNADVAYDCRFFRVYKDGRVHKYHPTDKIPSSDHPQTGVRSKDVVVSSETGVSVRLFLPKIDDPDKKLPLLFYIHGGGFSFLSAFSPSYDSYLKSLVAEANVIGVSVEYRLAPENPIPACYDDSWAALQWVAEIGWRYYEDLKKSGWKGTVEIVENHGEEHGFHLDNLTGDQTVDLIARFESFINKD
ncbi:unnamed protein product, partial [Vitis vinifera]